MPVELNLLSIPYRILTCCTRRYCITIVYLSIPYRILTLEKVAKSGTSRYVLSIPYRILTSQTREGIPI